VSTDSTGTFAAALATLAFVAWTADWAPFGWGEVVTYHAACVDRPNCRLGEMRVYRETYRADRNTLTVTSWGDGDSRTLSLYRSCIVRDKKNWVCNAESLDLRYPAMTDGELQAADEIAWYRYWWIRFLQIGK
jgi:hypothetical protein